MRARTAFAAGLASLALWAGAAVALVDVPPLAGRVNDRAGLLSQPEADGLEQQLAAFEAETSHQIVVLTIPTLDGEAIEPFAMRVAEAWKIGHEGLDNGAILVVAARDRRVRIEVGYGLEGAVPDATAARIIRDVMIPHFREGAMGRGMTSGTQALMAAARGEQIPAALRPAQRGSEYGGSSPVGVALFFGVAAGSVASVFARKRPGFGALLGGAAAAVLVYVIVASFGWSALAGAIGAIVSLAGFGSGGRYDGGGHYRGGSFGGGGFGGGFGGGGGGFGGGGASGSW